MGRRSGARSQTRYYDEIRKDAGYNCTKEAQYKENKIFLFKMEAYISKNNARRLKRRNKERLNFHLL